MYPETERHDRKRLARTESSPRHQTDIRLKATPTQGKEKPLREKEKPQRQDRLARSISLFDLQVVVRVQEWQDGHGAEDVIVLERELAEAEQRDFRDDDAFVLARVP